MQEAILKLLDGDHSADLAFWIIVALSFLLGMLVWALLAHWPAARKLKRERAALEKEKGLLQKDNKELSERLAVLTTKHQHIQEEWQTATAQLQEREEQVSVQSRKITQLGESLEAHRAQAHNYKQANEKLIDQYRDAAQTNKMLYAKLEDMKGLVEEVEQGNSTLKKEHQTIQQRYEQQERKLTERTRALEQAQAENQNLKEDLKAAFEQKAELKNLVFKLETTQQVGNISDEEVHSQLIALKTHVQELEQENNDLLARLQPFLDQQPDQQTSQDLEHLLIDLLIEAEESMGKDGFYTSFTEEQLIEDPQQLQEALAEREGLETEQEKAPIPIPVEEEQDLDNSLYLAQLAMERQGFYEDLDPVILVPLPPEIEQLSDEALLEQHLKDTQQFLEDGFFYSDHMPKGQFIEQEDVLEQNLKQLDVDRPATPEHQSEPLPIEEEAIQAMEEADALAQNALNQAGLYEPIEAAHLLADEEHDKTVEQLEAFANNRDLRAALEYAIEHQLPKANPEERDALQAIHGIGYVLERQLNELGLYTYRQLSQLSEELMHDLNAYLDLPTGTIKERDWVTQAEQLNKQP